MRELKEDILKRKSELIKVIAHPMRLCILHCLLENKCNVSTLIEKMKIPQSTISQHLSKLKMCGVIKGERKGVEIEYRVINREVEMIIKLLLGTCHEEEIDTE